MLKKTMIAVGVLVAAAISMPNIASAAPHRYVHARHVGFSVRSQRHAGWGRAAWAGARLARPAWGRFASPGYRQARIGFYGRHRGLAWHRVAPRRGVVAAYQPAPSPLAGLLPFAGPAQIVAAPVAAARAVAAPLVRAASSGPVQMGRASFYSGGGRTAAGGHVGAATCAHRSLPFGTRVLVTNLANARSTVLTVNDRGPFRAGRIVDVSLGAAGVLGMLHSGTAPVRVQVVGGPG